MKNQKQPTQPNNHSLFRTRIYIYIRATVLRRVGITDRFVIALFLPSAF